MSIELGYAVIPLLDNKCASQNDCWLIDVAVLIAGVGSAVFCRCLQPSTPGLQGLKLFATHLRVPTPPASRIKEVSSNGLPVQRIANARRIWPCATTRTSPLGGSGFSRLGRWYFSLISAMSASRRRTTSSGDLVSALARLQYPPYHPHETDNTKPPTFPTTEKKRQLTLHRDTPPSKYPKPPTPSPPSAPESPYSSTPHNPHTPTRESPPSPRPWPQCGSARRLRACGPRSRGVVLCSRFRGVRGFVGRGCGGRRS